MNVQDEKVEKISKILKKENFEHEWLKETESFEKEIEEYILEYKFHLGAEKIREFFWHTFCDKWIEDVKKDFSDEKLALLIFLLKKILITIHPFVPFISEAVWQELVKLSFADNLLMIQQREG